MKQIRRGLIIMPSGPEALAGHTTVVMGNIAPAEPRRIIGLDLQSVQGQRHRLLWALMTVAGTAQLQGAAALLPHSALKLLSLSPSQVSARTLNILMSRIRRGRRRRIGNVGGTAPHREAALHPVSRFFRWPPPPRGAVPKLASSSGPKPILDV